MQGCTAVAKHRKDHGHKSWRHRGMSPPEFGVGDANANCYPAFVTFQNFKHQTVCTTMQ